jgi:hypothetical protein
VNLHPTGCAGRRRPRSSPTSPPGRRQLTHQALDDLPPGRTVDHLHGVLVAAGTLPKRDERLVQLPRWVTELIAAVPRPEGRQAAGRVRRPGRGRSVGGRISCDLAGNERTLAP